MPYVMESVNVFSTDRSQDPNEIRQLPSWPALCLCADCFKKGRPWRVDGKTWNGEVLRTEEFTQRESDPDDIIACDHCAYIGELL